MNHTYRIKKSPSGDWHNADIVAALRKAGWSLRGLSIHHGLAPNTLRRAVGSTGYPRGEELIAAAIANGEEFPGITPADIWPSRYGANITPRRRRAHVKGVPNMAVATEKKSG